jgi:hypothetical protein
MSSRTIEPKTTGTLATTQVTYNSDLREYRVRQWDAAGVQQGDGYFTNDRDDAIATAKTIRGIQKGDGMKTTRAERVSPEDHLHLMAAYNSMRYRETPEDTARLAAVSLDLAERASLTWADEDIAAAALFFGRVNRERKDDVAMRRHYLRNRVVPSMKVRRQVKKEAAAKG